MYNYYYILTNIMDGSGHAMHIQTNSDIQLSISAALIDPSDTLAVEQNDAESMNNIVAEAVLLNPAYGVDELTVFLNSVQACARIAFRFFNEIRSAEAVDFINHLKEIVEFEPDLTIPKLDRQLERGEFDGYLAGYNKIKRYRQLPMFNEYLSALKKKPKKVNGQYVEVKNPYLVLLSTLMAKGDAVFAYLEDWGKRYKPVIHNTEETEL